MVTVDSVRQSGLYGVDGGSGVFLNGAMTPGEVLEFQSETGLLLTCDGNVGIPFLTKQGNQPSQVEEGGNGALLELCRETWCSAPVGTGISGIFPTQGLNPGLPHCRQILYQLSHKGSPRILEWVAYPFSSRSS